MKYILIVLMALLAVPSFSQEKDKEVMIKKIFNVLQQKDEQGFIKLFPDVVVMKEFIIKRVGSDTITEEGKAVYNEMIDEISGNSLQKQFGEMYQEIIEKGENKGIAWPKTKFISYVVDSSADEETNMARLKGKIYFNVDKMEYFLQYDEIIWFENYGWYGVSIDRVDEKSKENEPEEMDLEVADSTMMMVDTMAAEVLDTAIFVPETKPVIKPTKSTKEPLKGKTVKPKNQTAAYKPE